jgi:D-alanyl-D-alanine carboxypeptidase/D-alanyl-D-alanine-endopeptidase (penicillin-binding protein 4)
MIRHFSILSFLLISVNFAFSQKSKLNIEIEKLKNDTAMKHATWSVCVMPIKKDTVIADYNSYVSVVPASTMKIVTTAAALSILGSDFKFETKIQYDGILDTVTGILKGNIYILGGGDPTLESEYFKDKKDTSTILQKWATQLKATGIKKIEGAIIGDARIFEDNMVPPQWIWGDMGNYFGAGACGLSYHDNKYAVLFKSGVVGSKTLITSVVPNIGINIINHVTAGGNDDNANIYGAPYSDYRTAEGTIPANKNNYEVEGSMPDPALFCAETLELALKKIGINVSGTATTMRTLKDFYELSETIEGKDKTVEYDCKKRKTLITNYSPPLDKIIYWTNLKSINLYAEHLLKYICYKKNGIGTDNAGTDIVTNYWKNKGIDVSGFFMNDGCGLSRANVITTRTEVQILKLMASDKNFKAFYNSLPVAGKSGSLGGLCEGTCAENNLCAKSGYITRARGYAGYVKNKKGEMLCFSLLANNYDCTPTEMKKKLEKILVAIAETD